jgi:hypothetical protein
MNITCACGSWIFVLTCVFDSFHECLGRSSKCGILVFGFDELIVEFSVVLVSTVVEVRHDTCTCVRWDLFSIWNIYMSVCGRYFVLTLAEVEISGSTACCSASDIKCGISALWNTITGNTSVLLVGCLYLVSDQEVFALIYTHLVNLV